MPGGHRKDTCGCGREKQVTSARCAFCVASKTEGATATPAPERTLQQDREQKKNKAELDSLRRRYDEALKENEQLRADLGVVRELSSGLEVYEIEPKKGSGTSEGTVVAVASDWHNEEIVVPGAVSGLNEYNGDIFRARSTKFFQSLVRLVALLKQDIRIDTLVLALLGDFITNDIHGAENAEANSLFPTLALLRAQNAIISGIQFILDNTDLRIVVPCHSGNHARTTQTTRFASENGHSLEYLMYCTLASHFRHEPRVEFIIPEGMHSYLRIYDMTLRFQHGHAIKYNGGVGGIYIPANKAISQWDRGIKADLDVFGHFHQLRDGGKFLCNGSLIGYNAFALAIKADYEPPRQLLFLIDKKRGRTCTWPIIVD